MLFHCIVVELTGQIQTDQRFAGTWYSGNKYNRFATILFAEPDNLLDGFCCFCQIACAGIRTGNIINIVIAVKRLSRFDNGWSRHILRIFGSSCIVVVRKWHQAIQPQGLRGFGCLPGNEIGKFEHTRYTISSMFWMFRKP